MGKILESEFRKELYKNLIEAGYEKQEAQKIVGVKYHSALKDETLAKLTYLMKEVEQGNYDVEFNAENFANLLAELKKMKEFSS